VTSGGTCSAPPCPAAPTDVTGATGRAADAFFVQGAVAFLFLPRDGGAYSDGEFASKHDSGTCSTVAGASLGSGSPPVPVARVHLSGGTGPDGVGTGGTSIPGSRRLSAFLPQAFLLAFAAQRATIGFSRARANKVSTSSTMRAVQSVGPYSQRNLVAGHAHARKGGRIRTTKYLKYMNPVEQVLRVLLPDVLHIAGNFNHAQRVGLDSPPLLPEKRTGEIATG
jgi:hypothetical protein